MTPHYLFVFFPLEKQNNFFPYFYNEKKPKSRETEKQLPK